MTLENKIKSLKAYLSYQLNAKIYYNESLLFNREHEISRGYGLYIVRIRKDLKGTEREVKALIIALEEFRKPLPLKTKINGIYLNLWRHFKELQKSNSVTIAIGYDDILRTLQVKTSKEIAYSQRLISAIIKSLEQKEYIKVKNITKSKETGQILGLEVSTAPRTNELATRTYDEYREHIEQATGQPVRQQSY